MKPQKEKNERDISGLKNSVNGKILSGVSLNLEGPLNSHKFTLSLGSYSNDALQKDRNAYGPNKFIFKILEVIKVKEDLDLDLSDKLTLFEQIWIEKLLSFSDGGYN